VVGTKLEAAIKRTENLLNNVKSDTELFEYNNIFNALEIIRSQYQMLRAVTWRYTHPRFPSISLADKLEILQDSVEKIEEIKNISAYLR